MGINTIGTTNYANNFEAVNSANALQTTQIQMPKSEIETKQTTLNQDDNQGVVIELSKEGLSKATGIFTENYNYKYSFSEITDGFRNNLENKNFFDTNVFKKLASEYSYSKDFALSNINSNEQAKWLEDLDTSYNKAIESLSQTAIHAVNYASHNYQFRLETPKSSGIGNGVSVKVDDSFKESINALRETINDSIVRYGDLAKQFVNNGNSSFDDNFNAFLFQSDNASKNSSLLSFDAIGTIAVSCNAAARNNMPALAVAMQGFGSTHLSTELTNVLSKLTVNSANLLDTTRSALHFSLSNLNK